MDERWTQSENLVLQILNEMRDAVILTDESGKVVFWNACAEQLFGWPARDVAGTSLVERILPEAGRTDQASAIGPQGNRDTVPVEINARHKDGREFPVEWVRSQLDWGGRTLISGIARDVRHIQQMKEQQQKYVEALEQARKLNPNLDSELGQFHGMLDFPPETDALTGLFSRHRMIQAIDYEKKRADRTKQIFSLVVAHLDLKEHDTKNHDAFMLDRALVHLSRILVDELREQDMLSRWGERQFLMLLPDTPARGAKKVAGKVRKRIAAEPFVYNNQPVPLELKFDVRTYENQEVSQEDAVSGLDLMES